MAISKVIYGEETLIDLTADTVTAQALAAGATAHNAAGEPVVGTVTMLTVDEITQQAALKVDKESLGLNNVDNTSDMDKPVSTAQEAALASKAPAGYGLGESYSPFVSDANTITKNGFYQTAVNVPDNHTWLIIHQTHTATHMTQLAMMPLYNTIAVRYMTSGVWGVWRWINPPLRPGEEYCTAEAFHTYPVYIRALPLGTLSSEEATTIEVDWGGTVIEYYGYIAHDDGRFRTFPCGLFDVWISDGAVVYTPADSSVVNNYAGWNLTLVVKIIKNLG